ncbi:hypothetical protein [Nocardiopsis salina]|nr:hypothetical protein [Nocardiopsis salina]
MNEIIEDLFQTPQKLAVPDQADEYTKVKGDGDAPKQYDEI